MQKKKKKIGIKFWKRHFQGEILLHSDLTAFLDKILLKRCSMEMWKSDNFLHKISLRKCLIMFDELFFAPDFCIPKNSKEISFIPLISQACNLIHLQRKGKGRIWTLKGVFLYKNFCIIIKIRETFNITNHRFRSTSSNLRIF